MNQRWHVPRARVVLTWIPSLYGDLQLKINFQVPPSLADFRSIPGLLVPKHVYGIVGPLAMSDSARLASCSICHPAWEPVHSPLVSSVSVNSGPPWKTVCLPRVKSCVLGLIFPKMIVDNSKKVDSVIRVRLGRAWHLDSCPVAEIVTSMQSPPINVQSDVKPCANCANTASRWHSPCAVPYTPLIPTNCCLPGLPAMKSWSSLQPAPLRPLFYLRTPELSINQRGSRRREEMGSRFCVFIYKIFKDLATALEVLV